MRKALLAAAMAGAVTVTAVPVEADARQRAQRTYQTDNGIRYWRGEDGRYYCKRSNGTVGMLVGGVAGALVGRAIDTRGERTTGTILGAVAGAVVGREVEKRTARCR
jgi:outer membrane lipoprotein SlyB